MHIAIVHYHLDTGGITRVIESASRALTDAGIRHVILSGSAPETLSPALRPLAVQVPALTYLDSPALHTVDSLIKELNQAAKKALGCAPDIWHFHNHSLGKNILLGPAIARLAEMGERLVLQLHDLAEDGRPENYPVIADCQHLYPIGPRIHYAFINSRDRGIFTHAGLSGENSSLLIHPIPLPDAHPAPNLTDHPLVLAPSRGIRRKNIGELVLFSALAPEHTRFAISRAPLNPLALPVYENWRKFSVKHHLPIQFGVVDQLSPQAGASADFDSWVRHCSHFVSTSVAEGFGLPFLESIAHGKPLFGRNLPHLTKAHLEIANPSLYEKILVPLDWIDFAILESHLLTTLERNHRFYRSVPPSSCVSNILDSLIDDEQVDFGNLPESLQQGVIEQVLERCNRDVPLVRHQESSIPLVTWLEKQLARRQPHVSPLALTACSLTEYQKAIGAIYQNLSNRPESPIRHLPRSKILHSYLQPERFHFLLSALEPLAPKLKFRAVIFDIYGTLLIAPAGGVKPDPLMDPVLRDVIREYGHTPPKSPSAELHQAVLNHHITASVPYPEVDLCKLWRKVLALDDDAEISPMVHAVESLWHPTRPMPGAIQAIQKLSRAGVSLGLLSNAQCNTLTSLGPITDLFAPELTILSYQHGIAKPSPELFQILTDRLAGRKISPQETLYIGNDPLQDIIPAAAASFKTALFTGHPDSLRSGACSPDFTLNAWSDLAALF
jgi:FMN phosphatase YigB (HAD superfamily)/glycosyltransferase involved in cell wall biosynthesis